MSWIEITRMPIAFSARTDDSRPGPGPVMRTSTFLTPCSCAARPAVSAATCAANGVDLREPLKPAPPELAHDSALPWRSVIVMIVLLNDACTWQMPSDTTFLTFLRARCCAATCCGEGLFAMDYVPFFSDTPALRGPLRVRAFVRGRWPRTGRPRRCRTPRYVPRSIRRLIDS